eukprot:TRINITY_DN903_c0_g1_i1.p2 TRINITY_DN903_c0_g1~~TRINITY_DN903_c0_g1_i1.p2  ORF type:complete len:103 (-),score=22.47 TRINITY_DN903_c0_g1_i1:14-322(-)
MSEVVFHLRSPRDAFTFAREWSDYVRSDWHQVKLSVMHYALLHKFGGSDDLRILLLGTNTKILIEHTENDDFWGDGGDGKGKNWLGKLLMVVRQDLSERWSL